MIRIARPAAVFLAAIVSAAISLASPAPLPTETVVATYRVKEGREDQFLAALSKHWPMCRRLGLVLESPHLILKGTDKDQKTYFIEILTWRDGDAPDNAPAQVRTLWSELESLCESRLGHRGIEYPEVEVVASGSSAAAPPPAARKK